MKQVYGFSHFTKCGFKIHSSYNLAAMSFTPAEIATEIKKQILEFTVAYQPHFAKPLLTVGRQVLMIAKQDKIGTGIKSSI